MQVEQVADRLGQRARQLLHVGKAVQFQRVEFTRAFGGSALVTRHHLGFAFHVHLAQLLFQSMDGGVDFFQVEAHGAHLLLESRAVNTDFAGMVDQLVHEFGRDPDLSAWRCVVRGR